MNAFFNLPQVYQIAILLGARVEVYLKRESCWVSYATLTGIAHNTPFRVVSEDENIMTKVKELIPQFFDTIEFKGYQYLIPKGSIKEGSIIIMIYGFGIYIQRQQDGSFVELEAKEAEKKLDETGQKTFVGKEINYFLGNDDE